MKRVMIAAAAIIMGLMLAACDVVDGLIEGIGEVGSESTLVLSDEPLVIGFIYAGSVNDGGYTQMHHDGTLELQSAYGDSVECIWLENIDDTNTQAVEDAAKQLIEQGAVVVFGTSAGYGAPLFELAESGRYNDIMFMQFSGSDMNGHNFSNYFGAMEEPRYLSGIIAGMQTESNKLGYVATFPDTEVLIGINAFALGAQSVNPEAAVSVVYTNSRYDPEAERSAAEFLLEEGCDVIAQHVDSPGPQLAAAEAGAFSIGYNRDTSGLEGLEETYLTAPIWHQGAFLIRSVGRVMDGVWEPESYYGDMHERYIALAPLTGNVSGEARAMVEDVEAAIMDRNFPIFRGPIFDNQEVFQEEGQEDEQIVGIPVVAEGVSLDRAAIWRIDYLVRGVTVIEMEIETEGEAEGE